MEYMKPLFGSTWHHYFSSSLQIKSSTKLHKIFPTTQSQHRSNGVAASLTALSLSPPHFFIQICLNFSHQLPDSPQNSPSVNASPPEKLWLRESCHLPIVFWWSHIHRASWICTLQIWSHWVPQDQIIGLNSNSNSLVCSLILTSYASWILDFQWDFSFFIYFNFRIIWASADRYLCEIIRSLLFWVISIYAADYLGFCWMKDYSEVWLLLLGVKI